MMRDMANNMEFRRLISPVNVTDNTAQVSQIIDLANVSACTFAIATGSLADAAATFTVLVEDGDNSALTDNAAVADEFLIGTESGAGFDQGDDNETRKIGYIGPKRYVRLTITPAGNAADAYMSAVAILCCHRVKPQSSQG